MSGDRTVERRRKKMKHLIHRSSIFSRLLPLILSMVVFQAAVYLFVFWHPENDCYMVGFVADDFYDTADPVSGFS